MVVLMPVIVGIAGHPFSPGKETACAYDEYFLIL